MNIEQTWKSVLEQLQIEMPRASFETWVRDTTVISYADDAFTVAVRNAYARDWLESRLVSTINHKLVGILNSANVHVNFVVAQNEEDSVEVETEVSSNAQEEDPLDDDAVAVSPADHESAYEQIAHPDRAVYLSGYFRRWLRSIGPDLAWMYVSFRQAAYRHGGRNDQFTTRFSAAELAKHAGITERTFWNRLNNPTTWEKLSGLVKIIEGGNEWVKGPTPRRLPRRYTIAMTLPLTPIDTSSLRYWIATHIEAHGSAEGVLRAAAITSLDELIPLDAQPKDDDQALTVRALLRELFKDELADGLLESLSSALQAHLMPQNDLIVIPLFFLQHVLPHLDAGPGWMLILLRDMCYVNRENGETRNRVTVKGGYAEIAGWLGMSRPMTIWEWLHGKEKSFFKRPVLRVYTREVGKEKELGFETSERIFDVMIEDIPPQLLELALTEKDIHAVFNSENRPVHAAFSIGFTRLAEDNYANCTIAFTQFAHSIHATCMIVVTPLADSGHATCIVKSSLTLKPNSLTLKPLTLNPHPSRESETPTQPASGRSGRVGNMAFWEFDFLMNNNLVNPGSKANLLRTNKKFGRSIANLSTGFVSWLLYAYSPAGIKISDPVGLAIKRMCENVNAGAGGDFNRLAKLNPFGLKSIFDADMAGLDSGESLEAGIYKLNFHDLQAIHKHELYRRLFGEFENI